jgi:biofilm PGA synthesis lipoprotein PgaB
MRVTRRATPLARALVCALHASGAAAAAGEPAPGAPAAFPTIAILAYHDVSDSAGAGALTVSPEFLRDQIRACRERGWTILPLSRLLEHRADPRRLPPRVMVLTFDDGYRSALESALPVLRAEGVPATFAPITSFVGRTLPGLPPHLDWGGLARLAGTPGMELASHSHALHQDEPSDPHGGSRPSLLARRWLAADGRYEHREEYRDRIGDDLAESRARMRERLGVAPRVLVWPFGHHHEMARAQAGYAGFEATLALGQRSVSEADLRSGCLPRYLVHRGMRFADSTEAWLRDEHRPVRAAEVDLDALWDPDQARFHSRVETAVTRVLALGATHVMLPVCADPRRDGRLVRSYAMNHQVPVLAEAWVVAASAFRAAGLKVWAQVPSLALTWAWERNPGWRVATRDGTGRWSTRVSPDLAEVRAAASDFVTDLAVYLPLDGVLFDDDATLGARDRLAGSGSREPAAKQVAIRGLLEECKRAVRAWRPECRFGRAVPAAVATRPGVSAACAMELEDCLEHDDLVFLRVPAPRHGAPAGATAGELERAARQAAARWRAPGRTGEPPIVAMLPARDAHERHWLPAERQLAMAHAARRAGFAHLGTRPVAAEGELPLGLLEASEPEPAVKSARR